MTVLSIDDLAPHHPNCETPPPLCLVSGDKLIQPAVCGLAWVHLGDGQFGFLLLFFGVEVSLCAHIHGAGKNPKGFFDPQFKAAASASLSPYL